MTYDFAYSRKDFRQTPAGQLQLVREPKLTRRSLRRIPALASLMTECDCDPSERRPEGERPNCNRCEDTGEVVVECNCGDEATRWVGQVAACTSEECEDWARTEGADEIHAADIRLGPGPTARVAPSSGKDSPSDGVQIPSAASSGIEAA